MLTDVGDDKCENAKDDSNNTSGNNIHWMMKIITDPCECNPEGKNEDGELEEWPDDLKNLDSSVNKKQ